MWPAAGAVPGPADLAAAIGDPRRLAAVRDTHLVDAPAASAVGRRVFEPFVQLDRHLTQRSQQGVGLGLAISRELPRAMGDALAVESRVGEDSRFTLTLPRVEAPGA